MQGIGDCFGYTFAQIRRPEPYPMPRPKLENLHVSIRPALRTLILLATFCFMASAATNSPLQHLRPQKRH